MLLDLVCYECLMEEYKRGISKEHTEISIMTPFEEVNNDGIYEVNCEKGHKSKTIIDNIDFEILFEYGLNAIVDGYYRESVSSITASLERYYEFFIKTILKSSGISFEIIDKVWKNVSNQSERQLGAYIFLYCQTFGCEPKLLNPQKDTSFRNSVIHKGYIPKKEEAIDFADKTISIIETSLIELKNKYPESVAETFKNYGYYNIAEEKFKEIEKKTGQEQNYACVNILTTINVMNGREINPDDGRNGNIEVRMKKIIEDRGPRKLTLLNRNDKD